MYAKAKTWAEKMIEVKSKEAHWKEDKWNARKRLMTGILGEMAVEKYLGKEFIDWSIGSSAKYNHPDLSALDKNVGIKTVTHGSFPVIPIKNYYPQIIVLFRPTDLGCWICGLAEVDVLNKYQSMDLILSPALKKRNVKTGFYGFEHLKDVKLYE